MPKIKFLGPKDKTEFYFRDLKKGEILEMTPFSGETIEGLMASKNGHFFYLEKGEYEFLER